MKKTALVISLIFALAIAFSFASAKAEKAKGSVTPSPSASASVSPSVSSSASASSTPKNQGQTNAQLHRSVVANFVQTLVRVADREGGIGEQVRVIAQQQNQSASTTAVALEKVENRGKIKTFLIGSDYKNLGALRSELVQTRNRIEQLTRLADKATSADKADLLQQIKNLQQEQTWIENFIKTNENKFSLFGWLVKLFQ